MRLTHPLTHDDLVDRAKIWLKRMGCGLVLGEPFRARTHSREIPDAIGWRGHATSILVECKVSRADFLSDAHKDFRQYPELGLGQWRFYLCPTEIIQVKDLPAGWGLLWLAGRSVRNIHGVPGNCLWGTAAPFSSNRLAEAELLIQALRRVDIRGHLGDIYDPVPTTQSSGQSHEQGNLHVTDYRTYDHTKLAAPGG